MKTKLISLIALLLGMTLCAACALGATANASIVAPDTVKVTAPYAGTLLPFDLAAGDEVKAGDVLHYNDLHPQYMRKAEAEEKLAAGQLQICKLPKQE